MGELRSIDGLVITSIEPTFRVLLSGIKLNDIESILKDTVLKIK